MKYIYDLIFISFTAYITNIIKVLINTTVLIYIYFESYILDFETYDNIRIGEADKTEADGRGISLVEVDFCPSISSKMKNILHFARRATKKILTINTEKN